MTPQEIFFKLTGFQRAAIVIVVGVLLAQPVPGVLDLVLRDALQRGPGAPEEELDVVDGESERGQPVADEQASADLPGVDALGCPE